MTPAPHTAPTAAQLPAITTTATSGLLPSSRVAARGRQITATMMTIYEEHAEILQALGECNDPDTVSDLYERAMDVERRMKAHKGPLTVLVDVAKGAGAFLAVWAMIAGAFVL